MHSTGGVANPDGAHLMICVTVDTKKDTAIIVPVVTRHEHSDAACVLDVGDHPFIGHESCAAYDFARVVTLSEASGEVDKGKIKLRDAVGDEVLRRLQVGFVLSDETAPLVYLAGNGQLLTTWLKAKGLLK